VVDDVDVLYCYIISDKTKMWFMYCLSWVAMIIQICFVTLAIGASSSSCSVIILKQSKANEAKTT